MAPAAAATTAARDVRPESSRRRRRPLQCLAPGPLVSRTRALVEEQGRREARLRSTSWAPSGAAVLRPGAGGSIPLSDPVLLRLGQPAFSPRGESGSGGSADRAVSRTAPPRSFPPDPVCLASQLRPLRCRR